MEEIIEIITEYGAATFIAYIGNKIIGAIAAETVCPEQVLLCFSTTHPIMAAITYGTLIWAGFQALKGAV